MMMKKVLTTLFLAVICTVMHAQNALFSKYENTNGVSTVVVSKAMFRMMPNIDVGNKNIKKIASKIDNLKVLTCERQALINKIAKDAMAIYKKSPWEEVMRIKDQGTNTVIYMCKLGKDKYEYVLYNTEKGELSIINVIGNITLQEIKQVAE